MFIEQLHFPFCQLLNHFFYPFFPLCLFCQMPLESVSPAWRWDLTGVSVIPIREVVKLSGYLKWASHRMPYFSVDQLTIWLNQKVGLFDSKLWHERIEVARFSRNFSLNSKFSSVSNNRFYSLMRLMFAEGERTFKKLLTSLLTSSPRILAVGFKEHVRPYHSPCFK